MVVMGHTCCHHDGLPVEQVCPAHATSCSLLILFSQLGLLSPWLRDTCTGDVSCVDLEKLTGLQDSATGLALGNTCCLAKVLIEVNGD